MRFLVFVKQVPELDSVRFLSQLNRIERAGVPARCNPLDRSALEHALALRAAVGGEVIVVTMGPPEARDVLTDAIADGADRGVHLLDFTFAGADTLATARALSMVVKREAPDVVLCGRSTLDGATAQVGPQVAELCGLAQVTQAVEITVAAGEMEVVREIEVGLETARARLPVLITVERSPRAPSFAAPTRAAEGGSAPVIEELDADRLGGDTAGYGIRGSATYVQRIIEVASSRRNECVDDPFEGAERLAELIRHGLSGNGRSGGGASEELRRQPALGTSPRPQPAGREIWVVLETGDVPLDTSSRETLACANEVADRLGALVVAVVLSDSTAPSKELVADLANAGADHVLLGHSPSLGKFWPEGAISALCALLDRRSPLAILGPWSARTREWLPRVAARRALGMTGDFVGLDVEARPGSPDILDLVWLKPAWAGTALARVVARTSPSLGTLRLGAVAPLNVVGAPPSVEVIDLGDLGQALTAPPIAIAGETSPVPLDGAPVVVLLGDALGDDEARHGAELARLVGAALGGTRQAIASGLVPRAAEVSIEKRSIAPKLVIALGVTDRSDLVAVRMASVLVTVHDKRDVPAHQEADLALAMPVQMLLATMTARMAKGAPLSTS